MTHLATGSHCYSSEKSKALLDAWADMAAAELEAFDPDAYQDDIANRIKRLEEER